MSVQTGQAKLNRALKDLHAQWGRVQPNWRDENARRFEAEFIVPLDQKVRAASAAMSQLSETLARVRRDCQ